MNLIHEINRYGIETPDKIAHVYNNSKMTYKELKEKSDALAYYLIEKLERNNEPIIVYGSKEHDMLICFLACVKSGHSYIPVESSFPYERVKDIVEDSKTKLIFNIGSFEYNFQNCIIHNKNEINEIIDKNNGAFLSSDYQVKEEDVYYIIYTSGSTGKPKGVQITLSCVESFAKWASNLCNGKAKDAVFLNQAPFSFDLSVMDLYLALTNGSALYSIDKNLINNMKLLFEKLKESNVSAWVSTPSFADLCLSDSSFNEQMLPNLKTFLFCGETLTNNCVKKLHERFKNSMVLNMYGPTEATVAVTSVEITEKICENINPLPVGYIKEDCKLLIVDKSGKEVKEGEKGEIIIGGDSVSIGYYKNEEKNKKSFSTIKIKNKNKRCFKTGDEGYLKDKMLYYCGRIDFQIKLNGFRIELEDIENNFRQLKYIKSSTVIPISEDNKIKYLAGVVVLSESIAKNEFETVLKIKKDLKELLPEYMIPRKIILKDSLPMTTNGKVDRKILAEEIK